MKTIILEEILKSYLTTEVMNANKPDYTFNMVLSAMKEACRRTLELACENASTKMEWVSTGDYSGHDIVIIDEESIRSTINQVK